MKYIIFSIIVIALLASSCQQEMISPVQAEKFIKYYGNSLMDEARDIEILEDGSYAICGVDSLPGVGKRMVLIITDEYGNLKPGFPKYYSEEGAQAGANALVVKKGGQGGFLLVGYTENEDGGTTQKDLYLVRTSVLGEVYWQKSFGSAEDESVLHATEMISSGGFVLAGYQVRNGKKDIMVMGVTDQGDSIKLSLNYFNPNSDNAAVNYILNTGEQYLCVCTYNKIGTKGTDILVLNFDEELSPNDKGLGGDFDEFGKCIIHDTLNRYLVLGNMVNVMGRSEMVVHLIEINGLLITSSSELRKISKSDTDLIGERFVKTDDGRLAILGTIVSNGNRDIFLQFLQPDYTIGERHMFGSGGNQSGADIDLPAEGGLILLGTNSFGNNSMISLIRTDDQGDL